ncbi:unnamed protein product [Schistosoma bovis]|nr:unnamed protein product [Schistosoma bovis]
MESFVVHLKFKHITELLHISPKCTGTTESVESPLFLSKRSHMVTRIQSLSGKSYPLPSRGGGVVYESERTKSQRPELKPDWWIWRIHLEELGNLDSKPMVHMGSRVLI